MHIRNQFKSKEIPKIAQQIYNLIQQEKGLTKHPLSSIKKLIKDGSVFVSFNHNSQIVGFVTRKKITTNFFEIRSWYVAPKYRQTGLAGNILRKALKGNRFNYVAATFQPSIVDIGKKFGFEHATLSDLPPRVLIHFILSRNLSSIFKHLTGKKSTLLIRKCA
ncbi:hypothetical protein B5M47_02045 [candidate division CPR3 bacterium 4484_211]|uniref:N-acetyltransferase domain-containing protein n=1 Tax=candidate division CPR3 bacterium 4484_211 TaxID=1968527 RepID=A0A1W9NY30_UNCC3|nr:MAG: hypothetical protein B5M47_02045 [candidate division CPR3 bacterium 4484_211]